MPQEKLLADIDAVCALKARLEGLESLYRIGSIAIHRNTDGSKSPIFVLLYKGESKGVFYSMDAVKKAFTDPGDPATELMRD